MVSFKENKSVELYGKITGLIFSYFLSTLFLFLILNIFGKLPTDWVYLHVAFVTFVFVSLAALVKRILR